MTSSFSDSDDMSPTINNTLAVGTSVLAKFKGCGLKYFPARIIQIKDNSYVVEFYSHHTRKVSRKDLILTTDPSFTTCDV